MGSLEDAGKTANQIIEKVIDFTEEIAVKTVDVFDVIQEASIDFAQNAQEFAAETGDFVRKMAAEASAGREHTAGSARGNAGKSDGGGEKP